jgi:large subunit ribosomal protein L35
MPKMKTKKSIKKRFKVTKTGKVLRKSSHSRHRKSHKSKRQIKRQNQPRKITGRMAVKIKKALGKG